MSNINLDDSEDDLDLPPPTNNNGSASATITSRSNHKDPISLDTDDDDDEDDLPPPPAGNGSANVTAVESLVLPPAGGNTNRSVSLDDSDEDLPPPASSSSSSSSPKLAVNANLATAAKNQQQQQQPSSPTPKQVQIKTPVGASGVVVTAAPIPLGSPATANLDATLRARAGTLKRRTISDASMEAFLFKQSPTWPYVMQKRWVTLKGRMLSYYEDKTSTSPSGTIDLKGAQIIDDPQNAKAPHALGISGDTPSLKGRTFIFAASTRDEYLGWLDILKFVTVEPKNSEIHWFEKMAQGLY